MTNEHVPRGKRKGQAASVEFSLSSVVHTNDVAREIGLARLIYRGGNEHAPTRPLHGAKGSSAQFALSPHTDELDVARR